MSTSQQSVLCQLPPDPSDDCCAPATTPAVAPLPTDNSPGLSVIAYRIGTFSSLRRAMLDRITSVALIAAKPIPATPVTGSTIGGSLPAATYYIRTAYNFAVGEGLPSAEARQSLTAAHLLVVKSPVNASGATSWNVYIGTASGGESLQQASIAIGSDWIEPPTGIATTGSAPLTASTAFANWREGADGDYQTVLIELWAYLADILTFYQERIANEAFIGTAAQRDSTRRLAQLINYLPAPGAGAGGLVAFNVARDGVVTEPQGFRVGSRAQPGRAAAVFETSAPLVARAEHNAIPLSTVAPTNQFAQLTSFDKIFVEPGPPTLELAEELYYGAGRTLLRTLPSLKASEERIAFLPRFTFPRITYRVGTRNVVLDGVNTRLMPGDYVLTAENEHTAAEKGSLHQISAVSVDKASNTTTISWQETDTTSYQQTADHPVALYAMRVRASPFGSAAPNWYTLSPTLTMVPVSPPTSPPSLRLPSPDEASTAKPPYANWDDPSPANTFQYVARTGAIALDAVYDAVRATPDNPGWMALVAGDGGADEILRFSQAQPAVLTDYAMSARVTKLTLTDPTAPAGHFRIRDTLILTGAEKLLLHNDLLLPDPVTGDTLILAGLYPNLQDGQVVVFSGAVFNPSGVGAAPGQSASEVGLLVGLPQQDVDYNLTTVQLKSALVNRYVRSSTVLLANVVAITQGETVRDEVLGSSDGSGLQSYRLKKQPLTYLPSSDPQSASPVQSTLTVIVNGVQWIEQPTLYDSGPADQDFTVARNDMGQPIVAFGDGIDGMRPPTGVDNVHARYRVGLGGTGNVPAAGVQQLIDSLAGVQQVTNPLPTIGGTDPESLTGIRANAPTSVRSFDRAISTEDYGALALTFPGVAKASARWVLYDTNFVALTHPYIQLTVAATDGTPIAQGGLLANLRSFLDQRRDPNVALRVLDFTRVYVDFAVTVDLDDRVFRQATLATLQAALNPGLNQDGTAGYFSFTNLDFGESLHLSAIYAFIQKIGGVRDAKVTRFRRMDQDLNNPTMVRTDILIGHTEIAVIGNDTSRPELGLLSVSLGNGGIVGT
jgi:hypothetical protein